MCLAEKQQVPFLSSLVRLDQDSNSSIRGEQANHQTPDEAVNESKTTDQNEAHKSLHFTYSVSSNYQLGLNVSNNKNYYKARSLQFPTYYIHDSNNKMKYFNLHNKQK